MPEKKKVVILGAGPGGLAAAFGLTATQRLRDTYDVTVYQVGWRAGGKCATGRDGPENRIVQNGTHYLFGCYDNTLSVMRTAYEELRERGARGFGDFETALLPRDLLALKHVFRGEWALWALPLPSNLAEPGKATGYLGPAAYGGMVLQSAITLIFGVGLGRKLRPPSPFDMDRPMVLRVLYALLRPVIAAIAWIVWAVALLVTRLGADILSLLGDRSFLSVAWVLSGFRRLGRSLFNGPADRFWLFYKVATGWDFACTVGIGLLRDRVPIEGLRAIEDQEFTEWLTRHGAAERTLKAPFVSTWYDAVAAYEDGDPQKPNLSAGVSMMAIGRALLSFKGHFAYQMRSEVGDTLVGPIFECLRRRGVKFRFFHRVWDLVPGDGDLIDEISVERQVALKSGDPDSYEPFVEVRGLKVWPNAPVWDQIDLPAERQCADMDSFYTEWRGEMLPPLKRGTDFDLVVLAMPVASFPTYCAQILRRSQAWRDMVDYMPGVESQTMRLYFDTSLEGLGWTLPTPILSSFAMPFATWEDNGHLTEVETWPEGDEPRSIATLFGPLPAPHVAPPHTESDYPDNQTARVKQNTRAFLDAHTGGLWPKATAKGDPNGIDWSKLVDVDRNAVGAARLDAQCMQANSGPLNRYTMARAGTARHRLPSGQSRYSNMVLAGDWTGNNYLIGSVEGAVISGLQASRALSGSPSTIPGEDTGL